MSRKVALSQEYSLPNCLLSLHKFLFMRNSDIQTGLSYQVVVVVLPTFKNWCSGEGDLSTVSLLHLVPFSH